MATLFHKSYIKSISKIFQKKGIENVPELLHETNEIAEKELEYEDSLGKIAEQFAQLIFSDQEQKVEVMLGGTKDNKNTKPIADLFKHMQKVVAEIHGPLNHILDCNEENSEANGKIILILGKYRRINKASKLPKRLRELEGLCYQRRSQHSDMRELLEAVQKPLSQLGNEIDKGIEVADKFKYDGCLEVLSCIKSTRGNFFKILKGQLDMLGYEQELFTETRKAEELKEKLYQLAKDKSFEKTEFKKSWFWRRWRNRIIGLFTIYQVVGTAASTHMASSSVDFAEIIPFHARKDFYPKFYKITKHEKFRFTSRSGYELPGKYFECTVKTDKTVVLCHPKTWNMSSMKPRIEMYLPHYNVIVFDLLGHGGSRSSATTMGDKEKGDVKGIIDWLAINTETTEVALVGRSMGLAAGILASGEYELEATPKGVRRLKIVCVSGQGAYAKLVEDAFVHASLGFGMLPNVSLLSAYLAGKIRGYDPFETNPINGISPNVDYLLFQGEDDPTVSPDAGKKFEKLNAKNVRVVWFKGGHKTWDPKILKQELDFVRKRL